MSTIPTFARVLAVCLLLTTLGFCTGCGNEASDLVATNSKAKSQAASADGSVPTSVATSPVTNEVSPASIHATSKPKAIFDQSPKQLCQRFMELLQNNDSIKAKTLLTRISQMNTTKEELELKAIGGSNAKFTVGQVRYATQKKELAQVDCKVVDTSDDDPFEMEMTWVVRRNKKFWRISGVMLQLEKDAKIDLLSFENLADVRRIKEINDEQIIAEGVELSATRQAKGNSENTTTLQ